MINYPHYTIKLARLMGKVDPPDDPPDDGAEFLAKFANNHQAATLRKTIARDRDLTPEQKQDFFVQKPLQLLYEATRLTDPVISWVFDETQPSRFRVVVRPNRAPGYRPKVYKSSLIKKLRTKTKTK